MSAIEKAKLWRTVIREWRVILGFIAAPLIPGILFALPDLLKGDPMYRWYISFSAYAGYPIMLILGVPTYFLLKRWNLSWFSIYLVVGIVWGVAAYVVPVLPSAVMGDPVAAWQAMVNALPFLMLSIICGVIAAIAFWLIARPDRQRTQPA